jgi:hypothetical protein
LAGPSSQNRLTLGFQSILPSKTENKIIHTQKQRVAAVMAHYSACGIVLIHMQMDIAGCACNSNGSKKMTIN